jgi:hypothetical protein
MNILPKFSNNKPDQTTSIIDNLIRQEAQIGGQLFGPIPKGHDRQFFCLDEHTWVWHETWTDRNGSHNTNTRYEIRPNGVFKVQNGGTYQSLSDSESKNLLRAAQLYVNKILPAYQTA